VRIDASLDLGTALGRNASSRPLVAFNFAVEISVPGRAAPIADAAFSDCDGLEISREVKTLREGGNNGAVIRLSSPVAYGNVTLKRGMTTNHDLWEWFDATIADPALRADVAVVMLGADRHATATFDLHRCLPVRVKAPALNAKDGLVAVEELQIAYEQLAVRRPQGGGRG